MATTSDPGKPRFKHEELVAEAIEDGGARYIDVMDPDSGNVFRFYEVEYALACAMDGERDIPGIVKWATEELGVTPTAKEIQSVIATLGDLGYLDRPELAGAAKEPIAVERAADKPVEKPAAKPEPVAAKPAESPAQPAASDELARGVVVGQQAKAPVAPVEDVALGAAGSMAAKAAPVSTIDAPDLALGKPGAPAAAKVPVAPVEDIPLGHAGSSAAVAPASAGDSIPVASDVSLDLSDNMKIGLGDVKEAVRASRVMSAVEVPKDLMAELEGKPEPKKPDEDKKPVVEAKKPVEDKKPVVEAKKPDEDKKPVAEAKKPDEDKKPVVEAKKPDEDKKAVVEAKKPVEDKKPAGEAKKPEPKKPVVEEKKPIPPAPEKKTSPVLVVVLLLLLAGGAFAVWKFVLNKDDAAPATPATGSAAMVGSDGSAAPMVGSAAAGSAAMAGSGSGSAAPAAPAEVTAKLATEAPAPVDAKPLAAAAIEKLVADPAKPVKKGDVIALMQGGGAVQSEIDNLTKTIEREQKALDAANKDKDKATAANDTAAAQKADEKIKDRTAAVAKNTEQLTAKKAELEKLAVIAPADGKLAFTANGKVGTRTADAVATVTGEPQLVATFPLAAGTKSVDAGATVTLTHKADGAALTCTVVDSKPDSFKAACDASKAKADDEVVYKP